MEVPLQLYLESRMGDLKEYLESRMDEREKAYFAQLSAAKEQLNSTAEELQNRLTGMNEFRQQIESERALYVRREQFDELLRSRQLIVDALIVRLEGLETWKANLLGRQLVFGGAVIVIAAIVTAALRMVGH
jgi:hypothetical protein